MSEADAAASEATGEPEPRVSNLELFFDLVFVYTVTQVTAMVDHRPDAAGVAQAALVLFVLFWMYGGFAWLTNTAGTGTIGRRVVVLLGMAALLICSIAVPHAFDQDGIAFGAAYLALTLVHAGGFFFFAGRENSRAFRRVGLINIAGAGLLLLAGWWHGTTDWLVWTGVAVVFLVTLLGSGNSRFTLTAAHFAERHSLMIIIVLGESLISVTTIAQGGEVNLRTVVGVLYGLAASAGLWWLYFDDDEDVVERVVRDARPTRVPLGAGYDLTHLTMMAGVISVAAGTRLGYPDLLARASTSSALLVAAGGALFLVGSGCFRGAMGLDLGWFRVGAGVVLVVCWPFGTALGTGVELVALALLTAAVVVLGHWLGRSADRRGSVETAPG